MSNTFHGPVRPSANRKHPGFKAVAASIEQREGVSAPSARRILAAATRRASAKARRLNPRLGRVK